MTTPTSRMLSLILAATVAITGGCTRRFYRNQADTQVEEVISEKDFFAPWKIDQWHVYPDSHARFADPTNPDFPPKPFDDAATNYVSPDPQKPKNGLGTPEGTGYLELLRLWDQANRLDKEANQTPSPATTALPPATKTAAPDRIVIESKETPFRLRLEQAVELGVFNSRDYQDRREDLYLSALAVTLQRFSFTSQFFAGQEVIREYLGSKAPGGPQNRWSGIGTASVSKLFPTGALLLFRFASELTFEMAGNGPRLRVPSVTSLDIVQPFLRGGGQAVTLEPLTLSERRLLYNIRTFARFRQQFFVAITGGTTIGIGAPALSASFVQGNFVDTRLDASSFTNTTGYLPTLLRYAIYTNEKNNVSELERILTLYRALQGGGDVSPLQTDQVEQQLLNSRSSTLTAEQNLRDSLDRFKLQLGLPTNIPLELDDTPVRPLTRALGDLRDVFEQDRAIQSQEKPLAELPVRDVRKALHELSGSLELVKDTEFRGRLARDWQAVETLKTDEIEARLKKLSERMADLNQKRYAAESRGEIIPEKDQALLDENEYLINLANFELFLRAYEGEPWKNLFADLPAEERKIRIERLQAERFRSVFVTFIRVLAPARDERIERARKEWPKLPGVCLEGKDLIELDLDQANTIIAQAALTNRWDLMNARARLVDSWRQIAVQANSLLGVANLRYTLDAATPPLGNNPLAFNADRTSNRLALNMELPLTRQAERNAYRTALIDFQRERRRLQFAEDTVLFEVRGELRQLRVLAENYKIQRRQLEVTYSRRDSALENFRAPSQPGQASNVVANTQNLLDAQSRVPQTESALYTVYVNYMITRLQLFRDMELMPLDPRGVWSYECESCPATDSQSASGSPSAGQSDGVTPIPSIPELPPPQR